ncbi:MAG: HNH endonuclease, partial [Ilumatobacteraceae bacterium]
MDTARLRTAIEALLAADPDCLDGEELESAVRASSEVRSWLDAYEMRCARRSRQLADAGHAPPPESLLGTAGRRSGKDATTVTERDRVCTATPRFEAALTEGTVSAGHLDALANATRRLDDELRAEFFAHEDILVEAASSQRVDTFERQCRDLSRHLVASRHRSDVDELEAQRARSNVKRWVDKSTGMCHSHFELDPVSDAKLWTAIDAQTRRARQV